MIYLSICVLMNLNLIKSSDSNIGFVICDNWHKLVDVVRRDRKSYSYFHRLEPKSRLKVKTISNRHVLTVHSINKKMFPNAKIIIDPFHRTEP